MAGLETPWSRARKTRHDKQEERNGKLEGGSKQPNSGRFWRWKRDNILHEFLVETRRTDRKSYTISGSEFRDIERQAVTTPPGHLPAMQIDIGDLQLFVTRLSDHQQLELRLRELEAILEGRDEKEVP